MPNDVVYVDMSLRLNSTYQILKGERKIFESEVGFTSGWNDFFDWMRARYDCDIRLDPLMGNIQKIAIPETTYAHLLMKHSTAPNKLD